MRYLPKSDAERRAMLAELGRSSMEELFSCISDSYHLKAPLNLPAAMSEYEILDYFRQRAAENGGDYLRLLGAGVYDHFRPVVIDALLSRGEWFTAYTPYQAEISQGTLQAIFEFQTMMCQLTGQEVANASMYDGSTALPEAVMMAMRINGRHRVLVAKTIHPEYREVLRTYARNQKMEITELPYANSGQVDAAALASLLNDQTAAVAVQSPNFFGCLEEIPTLAEAAHKHGALLIDVITEPVSLGLLRPPAEADIVAMETQGLGLAPSYGGPYAGVIASKEKFVRSLPGRLAGQTTDSEGRRGFVLTLSTREQHIRREKATSNICTNQALCALAVTIFLSLYGKQGLRELAEQNLAKAHYLADELSKLASVKRRFAAPFFNEFVLQLEKDVAQVLAQLQQQKILGGVALSRWYPDLKNSLLVCVTETAKRADLDRVVAAFRTALG
ncbi:MAG TPA: aminomethyl-transferring glycine dehydrogenase subunit GcvPA [Candidatus Xenobia bacterium]|nr:aminomethyl-transferring glycine dehydrogenase subunit GcvPA [Candidatus Xenobia bacterium]